MISYISWQHQAACERILRHMHTASIVGMQAQHNTHNNIIAHRGFLVGGLSTGGHNTRNNIIAHRGHVHAYERVIGVASRTNITAHREFLVGRLSAGGHNTRNNITARRGHVHA